MPRPSVFLALFLSLFLVKALASTGAAEGEGKKGDDATQSTSSSNGESDEEKVNPKNPLSRGWNDDIPWVSLEAALDIAKKENKPIFLLIHKSWCHACKSLRPKFAKAKEIAELSKQFVMVNTEDDEEPWEEQYQPDGKYIPRIFFLDPEGNVMSDVKNPKMEYEQYQYYYSNPAPIITAMKQVLKRLESAGKPAEAKDSAKAEKAEKPKMEKGEL